MDSLQVKYNAELIFSISLSVISGRRSQEQVEPWQKNSSEKPTWRSANS